MSCSKFNLLKKTKQVPGKPTEYLKHDVVARSDLTYIYKPYANLFLRFFSQPLASPPATSASSPKPSALRGLKVTPQPTKGDVRPSSALIVVCLRKYATDASDVVEELPRGEELWQIQIEHNANPSVVSYVLRGLDASLRVAHAENDAIPESVRQLKELAGIHTVITKVAPNPQEAPFKEFRVAFYVPGDMEQLRGFLALLDHYFVYRATHPLEGADRKPWPPRAQLDVQVHPDVGIDVSDAVATFTIANKTCHPPSHALPLHIFDANPPAGNKLLLVRLEIVSYTEVAMTFEGRIWNLRHRFDAAGVPLSEEGNTPRVRFINEADGDLSQDGNMNKLIAIFGDTVIRGHVCLVRMADSPPPPDATLAHEFIHQLQALGHVYFHAQ